jgi:hypothetical protein
MKLLQLTWLSLVVISLLAFKNADKVSDHGAASGPSANGQGGLTINGQVQQFSFHARTDKNGVVSGSWESHSPGQDFRTHGIITCMQILPDGKTAVFSGVITHVGGEGFPFVKEGDPVWFKVTDNGEGADAVPDLFSDYYLGLSGCADYGGAMRPIENGNFQVKP